MSDSTPYTVPYEPGRWRAITLAVVVHAVLFAFLWFGIRWQNEKPLAVEAEIWSPSAQEAAPLAAQKIPEPAPLPPIEKPAEKVLEKPMPEPRREVATPPEAKPDIALEQDKKRKALKEDRERLENQHRQDLALKKKADEDRLKKEAAAEERKHEKQEQKDALKQKEAQKEAVQKQADKEKALAQKKREAEEASKIAAAQDKKHKQEVAKKAALAAADDAKLAKLRDEEMRRMTGGTSSASGSGGAGTAAKSQGNRGDPGYGDRIKGKIKSNTIFSVPNDLNGNPATIYEVNLLPDGAIRSLKLKKSSGVAGFDEAVKRGIEKSEPYPKDKSGEVPSSFELTYKPKD